MHTLFLTTSQQNIKASRSKLHVKSPEQIWTFFLARWYTIQSCDGLLGSDVLGWCASIAAAMDTFGVAISRVPSQPFFTSLFQPSAIRPIVSFIRLSSSQSFLHLLHENPRCAECSSHRADNFRRQEQRNHRGQLHRAPWRINADRLLMVRDSLCLRPEEISPLFAELLESILFSSSALQFMLVGSWKGLNFTLVELLDFKSCWMLCVVWLLFATC